jgi:hypothetical protein
LKILLSACPQHAAPLQGNKLAKLGTKLSRSQPRDSFERTVELGDRVEPRLKGDLADPQVRILKHVFRLFHPQAREIVGKRDPRRILEDFTKVPRARIYGLGRFVEGDLVLKAVLNETLGIADQSRFVLRHL